MSDNVNHPEHYAGEKECIDVMLETQGEEAVKGFCVCNAIKYLYRHRQKEGVEDVKKAAWYLNKYIELCESKESIFAQWFTKEAMGAADDNSSEKSGGNQISQLAKDLVESGMIGGKKENLETEKSERKDGWKMMREGYKNARLKWKERGENFGAFAFRPACGCNTCSCCCEEGLEKVKEKSPDEPPDKELSLEERIAAELDLKTLRDNIKELKERLESEKAKNKAIEIERENIAKRAEWMAKIKNAIYSPMPTHEYNPCACSQEYKYNPCAISKEYKWNPCAICEEFKPKWV